MFQPPQGLHFSLQKSSIVISKLNAVFSVNGDTSYHSYYPGVNTPLMHQFVEMECFFQQGPRFTEWILCYDQDVRCFALTAWHSSALPSVCLSGFVHRKCASEGWARLSPDYISTTCGWINRRQFWLSRSQSRCAHAEFSWWLSWTTTGWNYWINLYMFIYIDALLILTHFFNFTVCPGPQVIGLAGNSCWEGYRILLLVSAKFHWYCWVLIKSHGSMIV